MAYLTEAEVRQRATQTTRSAKKSLPQLLAETAPTDRSSFDVFLSHSSNEPEEILLGIKLILEDYNLTVYVDKYTDPQLSPDHVTPETAQLLRRRMRQCNTLLYVHSAHSKTSRWMPWELGFFDAFKGTVGIVPVTQLHEETFKNEEYLNLYPYVDRATNTRTNQYTLWINSASNEYAQLYGWAKGSEHIRKR